jgi:hypothetical protein
MLMHGGGGVMLQWLYTFGSQGINNNIKNICDMKALRKFNTSPQTM